MESHTPGADIPPIQVGLSLAEHFVNRTDMPCLDTTAIDQRRDHRSLPYTTYEQTGRSQSSRRHSRAYGRSGQRPKFRDHTPVGIHEPMVRVPVSAGTVDDRLPVVGKPGRAVRCQWTTYQNAAGVAIFRHGAVNAALIANSRVALIPAPESIMLRPGGGSPQSEAGCHRHGNDSWVRS